MSLGSTDSCPAVLLQEKPRGGGMVGTLPRTYGDGRRACQGQIQARVGWQPGLALLGSTEGSLCFLRLPLSPLCT